MAGMRAMFTRFRSTPPKKVEQIRELVAKRKVFYTKMPGLRWKAWVRSPTTGEYGAIYMWEDETAMRRFLRSGVWRGVRKVHGLMPSVEVFEVLDMLEQKG